MGPREAAGASGESRGTSGELGIRSNVTMPREINRAKDQ
jgi:hypothetical protein